MSSAGCRACRADSVVTVLSLGELPAANALLTQDELGKPEERFPLELGVCSNCGLAQLTETVAPEELFSEYPYFSSYSDTMVVHAEELTSQLIRDRNLSRGSLALEIASNDGYLLQNYLRAGVRAIGVDPARNVAEQAAERGVETICDFFGADLAERLRSRGIRADVVHAHNVLAHVPDINGLVHGIARVLADDGIAVIETPYVRDLVERVEFDTIYHEHVFYYSLTPLERLLRSHGLRVLDVERIPIHGGSLRILAGHGDSVATRGPAVDRLLSEEGCLGVATVDYFRGFAHRVEKLRMELLELLDELKTRGHRLAAYGAAAKGAMLLNAFGIGCERIEFVADRSEHKHGKFMPGVHIPIVPAERLLAEEPDEVLLLAWNFADEILAQQREYRERGGRFIIPIPVPSVS